MPSRIDRYALAREQARLIRATAGREVKDARIASGLSQKTAGAVVRMSHAQFGRIERAALDDLTVEQLARAAAAVGLSLSVRQYPVGDPVRDRIQLGVLERVRPLLPAGCAWGSEVPLPRPGDLRAWDALVELGRVRMAIEAETKLRDVQALDRRLALKQRDGGIAVLLLVVADTRANRAVLVAHREALRSNFPLDGHDVLAAFAAGRLPDRSGILLV